MKTHFPPPGISSARHREQGMATFVVLVLMAILVVLAASNVASLRQLQRETRLVEQRQLQRLRAAAKDTNAPAQSVPATNGGVASPQVP
jgi:hypothetical protein